MGLPTVSLTVSLWTGVPTVMRNITVDGFTHGWVKDNCGWVYPQLRVRILWMGLPTVVSSGRAAAAPGAVEPSPNAAGTVEGSSPSAVSVFFSYCLLVLMTRQGGVNP